MIRARWDVRTVLTTARDVEVGSPLADKGMALTDLAASLSIGREGIVAIGDNANDEGMLGASGIPVVMVNARDEIKRHAAFVTDTNEEDGAAAFIEQMMITMDERREQ